MTRTHASVISGVRDVPQCGPKCAVSSMPSSARLAIVLRWARRRERHRPTRRRLCRLPGGGPVPRRGLKSGLGALGEIGGHCLGRGGIAATPRVRHQASHCRQDEAYTVRVEAASSASMAAATRSASCAVRPGRAVASAGDGPFGVGGVQAVLSMLLMSRDSVGDGTRGTRQGPQRRVCGGWIKSQTLSGSEIADLRA